MSRYVIALFLALMSRVRSLNVTNSQQPHDLLDFIFKNEGHQNVSESPVYGDIIRSTVIFHERINCVDHGVPVADCYMCLSVHNMKNMLNQTDTDVNATGTSVEDTIRIGVVLLNYVLTFRACRERNFERGYIGNCKDYEQCLLNFKTFFPTVLGPVDWMESTENLLREIKSNYLPDSQEQCFSAEKVLREVEDNKERFIGLPKSAAITFYIFGHLLRGDCIEVEDAINDFLQDIFMHYGDECNEFITQKGLAKLMNDLKAGKREQHKDHETPQVTCNSPKGKQIQVDFKGEYNENRNKVFYSAARTARHTAKPVAFQEEHKNLANQCLPDDTLWEVMTHRNNRITKEEFIRMCPILVQQTATGVCPYSKNIATSNRVANDSEISTTFSLHNKPLITKEKTKPTFLETFLYGFLAVTVITVTSLGGVLVIPLIKKKLFEYMMMGFFGLSFGTMIGDSAFHMFPQFIGIHSHDEEEGNNETTEIPDYVLTTLGVVASIYGLFFFKSLIALFGEGGEENGHGHSHMPNVMPMQPMENAIVPKPESESTANLTTIKMEDADKVEAAPALIKGKAFLFGLSSMAFMMLVGDALHNFGDGVAIGAAFSSGSQGGISTTLAVFCHELPHELSDFAVLLSTGLSFKRALFLNFLSALTGYVGLGLGILGGAEFAYRKYILAMIAGAFLYIALGEMLPDLTSSRYGKSKKMFFMKNAGVILGFVIMFCIAVFEDEIRV